MIDFLALCVFACLHLQPLSLALQKHYVPPQEICQHNL